MTEHRPYTLIAELTYRCPLRCPYCSNPVDYAENKDELTTEEWCRVFGEAEDLGGDLAQRPLEDLGRLPALDQVAFVDDDRRHRRDTGLLPEAFAVAHLVGVGAAGQHFARRFHVEADFAGQFQQCAEYARIGTGAPLQGIK